MVQWSEWKLVQHFERQNDKWAIFTLLKAYKCPNFPCWALSEELKWWTLSLPLRYWFERYLHPFSLSWSLNGAQGCLECPRFQAREVSMYSHECRNSLVAIATNVATYLRCIALQEAVKISRTRIYKSHSNLRFNALIELDNWSCSWLMSQLNAVPSFREFAHYSYTLSVPSQCCHWQVGYVYPTKTKWISQLSLPNTFGGAQGWTPLSLPPRSSWFEWCLHPPVLCGLNCQPCMESPRSSPKSL